MKYRPLFCTHTPKQVNMNTQEFRVFASPKKVDLTQVKNPGYKNVNTSQYRMLTPVVVDSAKRLNGFPTVPGASIHDSTCIDPKLK
jgi:hypothetical protein